MTNGELIKELCKYPENAEVAMGVDSFDDRNDILQVTYFESGDSKLVLLNECTIDVITACR